MKYWDEMPTAPELMLDLLVADGGPLPVAALCQAGALFGLDDRVVRVALTRLVAQRKVQRTARGRYGLKRDQQALINVVDGWRQRESQRLRWNGAWVAVADGDVRRDDKTAWRHHELALELRGFATLSPGLRLRPDNLAGGVVAECDRLRALGLSPKALVMRLDDLDNQALAHARRLWDAQDLPGRCLELAVQLRRSAQRLPRLSLAEATRESLLLGRTVIAQLLRDPLLPPALMDPRPRDRLGAYMRSYQEQARAVCRAFLADSAERAAEHAAQHA